MVLPDFRIEELALRGVIVPFNPNNLQSYGYDATLANEFLVANRSYKLVQPRPHTSKLDRTPERLPLLIDPQNPDPNYFSRVETNDFVILDPGCFALGRSVEYFKIPHDILCICFGRSSYARCGVACNVTPLEPGWEGHITVEIVNCGPAPVKVYANRGIVQVIFIKAPETCRRSYSGKYNRQVGVVLSRGV